MPEERTVEDLNKAPSRGSYLGQEWRMGMKDDQKKIDDYAQAILDNFDKENSSICVLAMLSVIDHLALHEKASSEFKKTTISLLSGAALRIKESTIKHNMIN